MTESIWQKEECSPGRSYMLGKDPYIKYEDQETIISTIVEGLREFIHAEPAVRLTLDSPISDSERAVLAIPFETDQDVILLNFAKVLYQSLMGYYFSAVPQSTHFGITNMLFEGNVNSLLRREVEKLVSQLQNRADMAGRLLRDVTLIGKQAVPTPADVVLSDTIKQGLDIHVGYRITATGETVNCTQIFLPIQGGTEIIEQVYFNIEKILHQNFVSFDESGEHYLKITDTLVFKELCELIKRAKIKELTRNKIINNLQFDAVSKREEEDKKLLIGDRLYDMLNHIQDTKLREATDRSRDLYTSLLKATGPMLQPQLTPVSTRTKLAADSIADSMPSPSEPGPTEAQPSAAPEGTTPQARPFKRRAPGASDGTRRRKFQKVDLTKDELDVGNVQVPEPPSSGTRVPSPRRPRRVTRIRPEEVGAPGKKS